MIKVRTMIAQDLPLAEKLRDESGNLKVYRDIAPEGTKYPFVVWVKTSSDALTSIDCAGYEDKVNFNFHLYASSEKERDQLLRELRFCVNTFLRVTGTIDIPDNLGYYRGCLVAVGHEAW